ncbi:MAG: hypothetical protein QXL18_05640 [Candidatus Woesearchaeota archaeon]
MNGISNNKNLYSNLGLVWLLNIFLGSLFYIVFLIFFLKDNLKNKFLISKISNFSSYLWFFNVVVFIYVILASTKGFTQDPCYSPGCKEEIYLLPMLLSLILGLFFFFTMIISGLVRLFLKAEKWKPPFGIDSIKISFLTFLLIFSTFFYMIGLLKGNKGVKFMSYYTEEDLLNVINQYRKSKNLKELKQSEALCDNLIKRWKKIKEGKQHEGFEEWVKNEKILEKGYQSLAELNVVAQTSSEAINVLLSNLENKKQLESENWEDICVYADEGIGIIILGQKTR